MRSLLALGLAAILATTAAACSSAAPEETGASADDLVTGGICSTLDYGPRPAASELYHFFANDQAVAANVNQLIQLGILAQALGPGSTLRGVNTDARSVRLVGEVFEGFKLAFPAESAGLDRAPPVVVVQSNMPNAFAMAATFESFMMIPKSPWFFVVSSALLEHGNTDDELRAVFAHEIGHLVLQTFQPKVQARVRHAYSLGTGSEDGILGAAQADDPALADPIGRLLGGQSRVGGVSQLGMNMIMPGVYFRLVSQLLSPTESTSSACSGIQAKAQQLAFRQIMFLPGAQEGNLTPRLPSAAEKAELDRLTDALAADLKACAGPNSDTSSLAVVSALMQQLSPAAAEDPSDPAYAEIRAGMLAIEKQVDAEMPGALLSDKILRAEALVRADVVGIRNDASLNLPRVRVYDYEEDADDASMRVLSAIGGDPVAIGTFALSMLKPASKAACLADVAAGKPIDFGGLYDVHPLHCWRYYHATQFSKSLATCTSSGSRRAPLETHLPVIATDPQAVGGIQNAE
ncbi:MAG: M48 family metalloprotease [Labilithrix sp.]|nr:M48 family metalloprotease [Labilithrix sp.]MCW5815371.1 M48 family metalloprotease [Labilithrix sp.]